jgi:hypothetical protein
MRQRATRKWILPMMRMSFRHILPQSLQAATQSCQTFDIGLLRPYTEYQLGLTIFHFDLQHCRVLCLATMFETICYGKMNKDNFSKKIHSKTNPPLNWDH